MSFENTASAPVIIGLMYSFVTALFFLGFFVICGESVRKRTLRTITIILGTVASVGIFFITVAEVRNEQEKSLISNIEQKYDVDEVLLEYGNDITEPGRLEKGHVSVRVDDKVYTFGLEQDPKTHEPTLIRPEKWHDRYEEYKTYDIKPFDIEYKITSNRNAGK